LSPTCLTIVDTGPVPLVLGLHIAHERWGSTSNPSLNDRLNYPRPTDIGRSLNETSTDKIRDYRADYNNRPSDIISFMGAVSNTSDHLHCDLVRILFMESHRETERLFVSSRVHLAQSIRLVPEKD
jgi:hypothetical protein